MADLTYDEEVVIKQYEQRERAHRAEAEHQLRLAEQMRRAADAIRANPMAYSDAVEGKA